MQSLSWSLSLAMQSLSLSLLLKSSSWSLNKRPWSCPCDCVQMVIAIVEVTLIAKYFTTNKHFTYYLLSSEGWHFRRAKINPWGQCPIIDLVIVFEGLVLVNHRFQGYRVRYRACARSGSGKYSGARAENRLSRTVLGSDRRSDRKSAWKLIGSDRQPDAVIIHSEITQLVTILQGH